MRLFLRLSLASLCLFTIPKEIHAAQSIARTWDEQNLSAIRIDSPNPPVHARNLFHLSVCMYDAWAAYDPVAVGYLFREKHTAADVAAARQASISFAAYRLLKERYVYSKSASNTIYAIGAQMTALGYDTNNTTMNTSDPIGLGNAVYATVSAYFIADGARQTNAYADYPTNQGGYIPINAPLITGLSGAYPADPNRWQRLAITNAVDQNGFPLGPVQVYVGAQWLGVRPFALTRTDPTQPWINPGPQPRLSGVGDARFRTDVLEVIAKSGMLTPDDGATMDISPGAFGNNTLGANDGTGHPINPYTGSAYPSNVVKRGDFGRVLAEFWADGPSSETPPGHWNVMANNVADNTNTVKKIGGMGSVVDNLEWDVKVYFALNAAVHEAACAAWSVKRFYDGGRPIEWVRYMGEHGESSDNTSGSYNPIGLPLLTNVVELVTSNTIASGRHAGFSVGQVVIFAWPGQPANPATQHSGAKWMLPADWLPYQKANFVTPAFPGYISGHSTFSRSAAEVLAAITGTNYFPGGMATFTANSNAYLTFEQGPSQTVQLQWATYFDASDQAGISRLFGGIHVSVDDLTGRITGSQCGKGVWALAQKYYNGSISNSPSLLSVNSLGTNGCLLTFNTLRGMYYNLQSTPDITQAFTNMPGLSFQAVDSYMFVTDSISGARRYYRVATSLSP